jgi:uncharacterized protein
MMIESEKPLTYLTIARQGLCRRRDYLAAIALAFITAMALYSFFLLIATILYSNISDISFNEGSTQLQLLIKESLYFYQASFFITYNALLLGLILAVEGVHKRNFLTLISTENSIDWRRIYQSFGLSLGLYSISFMVSMLIKPSRFSLNLNFGEWLPFALTSLVIIPISSFIGSLWLGYVIQGVGLFLRKPIFSIVFWGLLLGSSGGFTPYWLQSVFYSMFIFGVIIKDNRLELMIGMLTADAIFNGLFFIKPDSIPKTPAFFTIIEARSPIHAFIATAIQICLFYFVFFVLLKKPLKSSSS